MQPFDPIQVRQNFSALSTSSKNESQMVYLDSAATTQKPQKVLDCLTDFYTNANGSVHRASHSLALAATQKYEHARQIVADFINTEAQNIVFTRGATESINLIAQSYGASLLKAKDEIIISEMEHHANIVPWQQIAKQTGAKIVVWKINPETCRLNLADFEKLLNKKTKIVAIAHTSNVTGTRHPIEKVIAKAHEFNAVVVVDAAQGIVHERINVSKLNADFLVFSGHKLFAPTGIGVLYGKAKLLNAMPPWQTGGKMIETVSFEETRFASPPARFEAGTPNTANAVALAEAIKWYQEFSTSEVEAYVLQLKNLLLAGLNKIQGMNIIGLQPNSSTIAFNIDGIHHNDLATLLGEQGIAVRSGKHCAEPMMKALGINGCVRISIALYNNESDIIRCIEGINKACELFKD